MRIREALFGLSLVLLSTGACGARAQTAGGAFSFDKAREPVASLDGQWRFHPGDDTRWAQPDFDDSKWPLIETGKNWYVQGYPHMDGFAWYRATIEVPDQPQDLSLLVPYVVTSYQVFADGRMLGGVGAMPPRKHPIAQVHANAVFRLPAGALKTHSVVIAFRVWHSPLWQDLIGGEIGDGVRLGATPLIEQRRDNLWIQFLWSEGAVYCLALIALLAACASLGFYLRHPAEKEYLWFMAAQVLTAATSVLGSVRGHVVMDVGLRDLVHNLLMLASIWATVCFFRLLLGGARDWLFKVVLGSVAVQLVLALLFTVPMLYGSQWRPFSIVHWNESSAVLFTIQSFWVVGLLIRRAVQGRFDARLLLAPVLVGELAGLVAVAEWIFDFVVGHRPAFYVWFFSLTRWPFPISVPDVCDFLFLAGMLAIFVHRFQRTSRMQDAQQRELEAARTVQQVLVPQETPAIPGFAIETVYRPAGVVGGDFFQVLPHASGALAVVGDVSGKGLPAAMTVSLLVGTLRTLAQQTVRPGEILAAMNRLMLGRSDGGFTTCLVLHAGADGSLTAASAGHLAPYVDGREVEVDTGLPLGLGPADAYPETSLRLEAGQQLTLITDGVVEARNERGELFGFARAAKMSANTAESIAEEAQQFGQEDDITVVTIERVAAEERREVVGMAPAAAPA